jgi:hypothetical protein
VRWVPRRHGVTAASAVTTHSCHHCTHHSTRTPEFAAGIPWNKNICLPEWRCWGSTNSSVPSTVEWPRLQAIKQSQKSIGCGPTTTHQRNPSTQHISTTHQRINIAHQHNINAWTHQHTTINQHINTSTHQIRHMHNTPTHPHKDTPNWLHMLCMCASEIPETTSKRADANSLLYLGRKKSGEKRKKENEKEKKRKKQFTSKQVQNVANLFDKYQNALNKDQNAAQISKSFETLCLGKYQSNSNFDSLLILLCFKSSPNFESLLRLLSLDNYQIFCDFCVSAITKMLPNFDWVFSTSTKMQPKFWHTTLPLHFHSLYSHVC